MQDPLDLNRTGFFGFHPVVRDWFEETHQAPTMVQAAAWPVIARGDSALIAAPTGTGKTLAAWLPAIDRLIRNPPETVGVRVLYVSPLRALGRDMVTGLLQPLDYMRARAGDRGFFIPTLGLRTGDTPAPERRVQFRKPPEMLVTTPESLFVLLASPGGRKILRTCSSVIVDEIHAIADGKRGADLSLSLERLEHLAGGPLQRIGVSATQRPVERIGEFLAGAERSCTIVQPQTDRMPDVRIELPGIPLDAFPGQIHWQQIHGRLAGLSRDCRSVLVFCNTRAQVERTAAALSRELGEDQVAAHHASLGQERRFEVEQGLKLGNLKVVVTSASLELGIDIGAVDLVCQLGSPSRINPFRQRAGRSCHRPGGRPAARIFPLSLADLLESRGLVEALERGELDETVIPRAPADVLCQHLVAMVAAGSRDTATIHQQVRRAWPWRALSRESLDGLLGMICDGFVPGREGHRALIRPRADNQGYVAGESAARIVLQNAGTIPEWFDYEVVRVSDNQVIGSLDEEFSFESSPGQIIQLGNRTLRILSILPGRVLVEEAEGEAPDVPFWFGDGPGRSPALSAAVCRVLARHTGGGACPEGPGSELLEEFLEQSRQALGTLPGADRVVLERFFDPGGDQHLVIHAPFGAAINRAWGLALRKRFCRNFNFELQAAALDNGLLLSLGATHSFALMDVIGYLKARTARRVLVQALLDTPVYLTRFRWCANTALAIRRRHNGRRVAAQIQRNQAENLIARVFPDQLACLENLQGDREIPDHPLVDQALADCLNDYLDAEGLEGLLQGLENGRIRVHCVETPEPSPLARALIHAPRHAFLDPAAAEERRTRTFEVAGKKSRGGFASAPVSTAVGWIRAGNRGEFEQALVNAGYITVREGETGVSATGGRGPAEGFIRPFRQLVRERAAVSFLPDSRRRLWCSVERLPALLAVWPEGSLQPELPADYRPGPLSDAGEALNQLLLARVRVLGRVELDALVRETGLPEGRLTTALEGLKGEGVLMRDDRGGWMHRDNARPARGSLSGAS